MPSKFGIVAVVSVIAAALGGCAQEPALSAASNEDIAVTRTNNHIDYVEFAAADLETVKKFYSEAFGWEFQDWGPDYVSFSGAGVEGGFNSIEAPVPGSTLVILYAVDLEESEGKVIEAGGEIIERHEFPGGRRFHFRDPAGNVLGVWTIVQETEQAAE